VSVFFRPLPKPVSAAAVAACVGGGAVVVGDAARTAVGISGIGPGAPNSLAFCDLAPVAERVARSACALIIVGMDDDVVARPDQTLIRIQDPRRGFIAAVQALLPGSDRPRAPAAGIHPDAVVALDAEIAPTAAVGARVVVGARTRIGPGAVVYDDCTIGADVCIGPNAVLGWVGLAYHADAQGHRHFFPHLGGVRIGDATDVGAGACICRGMLSDTVIGRQVKIGSLVYVSHGVIIDDGAWISASVALAGHSHVGADALVGIGAVLVDNVDVGSAVMVGGGSVVTRDAATGEKLVGVPAHPVAAMKRFGPTPR